MSLSKSLVYGFGVAVLILFVVGFIVGAIGSKFTPNEPFLDKPEVHLAPQLIYDPFLSETHLSTDHDIQSKENETHGDFAKKEDHGLPNHFVITNTLISSWIATLLLIILLVIGARGGRSDREPTGLYNIIEAIISTMYGFVEGVAGENARKFFPLFATIFFFVLVNAWLGLIPIFQSLSTWDSPGAFFRTEGHVTGHLLRPAGTDLNMPLALAIVSFFFVEFWGIKTLGFGYFSKFFRFGALLKGKIFEGIVDFFVGILELLSEFIRLVSFTFRLFGNMTAGEILLLITSFLIPFAFSLPFYGLELLVGVIQALIFSALTLVFVTMAIEPHGGEDH